MKKTIILIVFLFIAIIVISGLYFSRLSQSQNNIKRYIASIPANASLLISFNNDSTFYNLFKDYKGFEKILGKDETNELRAIKENLLGNSSFSGITKKQPVYISFHTEKDRLFWLISMPILEVNDPQFFQDNLGSTISVQSIEHSQGDYYELSIPGISRKLFASIQPERAMISFSKSLLERSLDKQSDHLSELFLEKFQQNSRGNSSPLQLYINNDRLKDLLSLLGKKTNITLSLFEAINGISMLDLNYKSDVVMFSGTSSITPTDSSYLSLFITQEPINHQLKNWLTTDVAEVSTYGVSNYNQFHTGLVNILEKRKEISQLREQIRYIEDKNEVVVDDELLPIWGNEFAKLTLKSGEEIGLVTIRDSLEYSIIADKISSINADSSIRQFDNSNLLYYALGDPFKNLKRPYFTYFKGFLVIANNQSTVTSYIEQIQNGKLLVTDKDFILYEKLQSTSSNFSLFILRENADGLIERNLNDRFQANYKNIDNFGYKDFYGFSLELSGNGEGFVTNVYGKLKENSQTQSE